MTPSIPLSEIIEQRLLDSLSLGVFRSTVEGEVIDANPAALRLLGLGSLEEMPVRCILDFYADPADRRPIERLVAEEEVARWRVRVRRVDGACFWAQLHATLLRGAAGEPRLMQIVMEDVTQLVAAKEALWDSGEHRIVTESASDVIVTIDEGGRILFVNGAAQQVFGYPREQLLGQPITVLMPERLRSKHRKSFQEHLQTGRRHINWQGVELAGLHRDGREISLEISFGEFTHNDRRYFTGVIRDISERKEVEAELSASEQRYRELVEKSLGLICSHDLAGNLLAVNPAAAQALGYEPAEMVGKNLREFMAPAVRHLLDDYLRDFPAKKTDSGQLRLLAKGGEERVWHFQNALCEESHRPPYVIGHALDITDRRRAEEETRNALSLLSATLESTADGILVVDPRGRMTSFNRKFAEMWRIPEPILSARDDDQALAFVLDQLKDPTAFLAKVRELYGQPDAESYDVLEFKDGRVFERYSQPQRIDGKSVGRVWSFRDVTERRRAEERIQHQAYHDALTGLPNRLLIKDRLSVALAFARRHAQSVAVLFLDLDNFKLVNDTLGHSVGDELLQAVAERLKGCVREGDTIGRLGGDEFTLVLPDIARGEDAARIAQKVLETIAEPFVLISSGVNITTSIGVSLFPNDGSDVEMLLKSADTAMYRAKELGRNTYQLSTPEMNLRAVQRMSLMSDLRQAVQRHKLVLYYQPILDLQTQRVVTVEALLRWRDAAGRLIAPADFIAAAEDSHLIVPIGEWALRSACEQVKLWQEDCLGVRVAVNLSARQFQQQDLAQTVAQVLRETGLDPGLLELEITETIAMTNVERTICVLQTLRAMGVRIAIDDFGRGQTSLSYLRRLPISAVKVDATLIQDTPTHPEAAAILTALIAMARALKLQVIAEGVETDEQFAFLLEGRCDAAQGYLFSRPLPAEALGEMLRGRQA